MNERFLQNNPDELKKEEEISPVPFEQQPPVVVPEDYPRVDEAGKLSPEQQEDLGKTIREVLENQK